MKKYSVQLASLVLFFALFASGAVVGMEKELPESKRGGEILPELLSDVKNFIATKTLRVMLDEAEDNPAMLMEVSKEKKKKITNEMLNESKIWKVFGLGTSLESATRPIDMIIFLIENGADPNTKNYKGHTVLSLLIRCFIDEDIRMIAPEHFNKNVDFLRSKLKLLTKRNVNFNQIWAADDYSRTIAHVILKHVLSVVNTLSNNWSNYYSQENLKTTWSFIFLLKELGVDFTTIKDANGYTACELGQLYSQAYKIDDYSKKQLNILCSPPPKFWSFFK